MAATDIPGERGARVSLDGAVAVVTGATAGIGAATARMLHERGARVVVAARRADRLEELAAEIDGLAVPCDVGDWDAVQKLVARAVEWGGRIDVMVNNAGRGSFGRLHEADPADAAAMVRVNVMGVIHGIRAAGARMAKQGSGGIVNVSSIVGEFPDPGGGAYAATKAAVDLLSRTAYRELRDEGVHVVLVKPALTDTEFSSVARGQGRRMGGDPPRRWRAGSATRSSRARPMSDTAERPPGVYTSAVATVSAPDELYFTPDPEANRLIATDPNALLIGFALDQQVTVQKAFSGPLELKRRLGHLDPARIAATPPEDLAEAFRARPAIHRFPGADGRARAEAVRDDRRATTTATAAACGRRRPPAADLRSGSARCRASAT